MTYLVLKIEDGKGFTEKGRTTDAGEAEQLALQEVYARRGPIAIVQVMDVFQLGDPTDTNDAAAEVYAEDPGKQIDPKLAEIVSDMVERLGHKRAFDIILDAHNGKLRRPVTTDNMHLFRIFRNTISGEPETMIDMAMGGHD